MSSYQARQGYTTSFKGLVRFLADLPSATPKRMRAYAIIVLLVTLTVVIGVVALSPEGIDPSGKPIGTDFVSFFAASKLARAGRVADVYDPALHHAAEVAIFGRDFGYWAYFYPPTYLLICLPLAAVPYFVSLGLWLAATGGFYLAAMRRLAGPAIGWIPLLAFPAVFANAGHGQNAFLSTGLVALGFALMRRRPILAGIFLGLLIFKPHLGLFLPLAFALGGRWRTFVAAGVSAAVLLLISLATFGVDIWRAFLAIAPLAREAMETNQIGWEKMQSAFAAARLLHASIGFAYVMQGVVIVTTAVIMAMVVRRRTSAEALGAMMGVAIALGSPFLLDYDLLVLALPLAWVTRQGIASGFLPWEKLILIMSFVLPGLARSVSTATGMPLTPIILLTLLWVVARRVRSEASDMGEGVFINTASSPVDRVVTSPE